MPLEPEKCCQNCCQKLRLNFRRIRLILWKNWIIRKQNLFISLFELLWPINMIFVFFILIVWLLILGIAGMEKFRFVTYSFHGEPRIWEMSPESAVPYRANEEDILQKTRDLLAPKGPIIHKDENTHLTSLIHVSSVLGYTPFTSLTQEIIQEAMQNLGLPPNFGTQGYNNNAEIENLAKENFVASKDGNGVPESTLVAAVIFEKGFKLNGKWASSTSPFPDGHTFSYKIRICQPDDLYGTGRAYDPSAPVPKERQTDREFLYKTEITDSNPIEQSVNHYPNSGFAGLQIAIDKAIIKLATKKSVKEKITLEALPYKTHLYSNSALNIPPYTIFNIILPLMAIIGFAPVTLFVTMRASDEKSTGIKELMKMSGLPSWMHWTSWMLHSLAPNLIASTFAVIVLFIPFNAQHGAVVLFGQNHMTLWWFVFFLFITATIAFGFFLSSIFLNGAVAMLVGLFAYLVPSFAIIFVAAGSDHWPSFTLKMATSLIPSMGLHWSITTLIYMQALGELGQLKRIRDPTISPDSVGGKWNTMSTVVDDISVGYCCLMLVVDTILYTCLAMYFENIWPGEYGVRKPFYYILLPPEWMMKWFHKTNRVATVTEAELAERKLGFEPEPELSATVEVKELTKRFGRRKIAVNSISFKMFDGQITVLLGHNGAGKTTAMSMITGLIGPTSGTAIINGMDMRKDMDKIRENMGLCPQHSMFFEDLSVSQNLKFFALIKGRSFKEADSEVDECLQKLHLADKKNTRTKTLSGGQKRKLSLGMALIGDTKLLILDEPSSGMDPETRRIVWDLLLEIREGRVILITTHFMEEADALGDRIVIMAEGEVKCFGTPMFLKQVYGAGYTLKFTTEPDADKEAIVNTVKEQIPKAFVKDQKFEKPAELSLTLPTENNLNSLFPSLFNVLSKKKTNLGILTMSLQMTTMDEVFLRVGELSIKNEEGIAITSPKDLYEQRDLRKLTGAKLVFQQIFAVVVKRFIFTVRRPIILLGQLLFPLIMLWIAIRVYNSFYTIESTEKPALEIAISHYSRPISYYSELNGDFGSAYSKAAGSSAQKKGNFRDAILKASTKDDPWGYKYRFRYVIGAEQKKDEITAFFSPYALHACPLSINAVTNAILGKANKKTYKIEIVNHPLKFVPKKVVKQKFSFKTAIGGLVGPTLFGLFMEIGLALFGAIFIIFPVTERLCGAKQLQLMTGVNIVIFWGTSMVWDNIIVWIMTGLMIGGMILFQLDGPVSFSADWGFGVYVIVFVTYGFSTVSYAYMWHRLPPTVRGGCIFLCLASIVGEIKFLQPIMGIVSISRFLGAPSGVKYITWVAHFVMVLGFPLYGITSCTKTFVSVARNQDACRRLLSGVVKNSCVKGSAAVPECCDNCQELLPSSGYFCLKENYFAMIRYNDMGNGPEAAIGLGLDFLFLVLAGILYTSIFFYSEFKPAAKEARLLGLADNEDKNQGRLDPKFHAAYLHNRAVLEAASKTGMSQGQATPGNTAYPRTVALSSFPVQPETLVNVEQTAVSSPGPQGTQVQTTSSYPRPGGQIVNYEQLAAAYQYQFYNPQPELVPSPSNPNADRTQATLPKTDTVDDNDEPMDLEEDVLTERNRVKDLISKERTSEDALVVHNLTKKYGMFEAVSSLSFGVHHGECFGLLGVNGAGKTTAFRMLTGDEEITRGTAYNKTFALDKFPRSFLKNIGYCQQSDSFFRGFTGKQMLELYCRLRGVAGSASTEAERWLTLFGLLESKNVQCQEYSGGMKRRLNAAMSMIGDPAIILFDEPTSGVDPMAQHLFWDMVLNMRGSEQAVILTSHSMAECEALCSRLGIMVNGQFQCFGGGEHLKDKYGEGFSLFVKLKPSSDPELVKDLKEEVENIFNPCALKDEHLNIIQYQVLNASMTYGEIFQATENLKAKFEHVIEEYSVNDTTLEEVFLTFARKQYPERPAGRKRFSCKNILFCDCECECRPKSSRKVTLTSTKI